MSHSIRTRAGLFAAAVVGIGAVVAAKWSTQLWAPVAEPPAPAGDDAVAPSTPPTADAGEQDGAAEPASITVDGDPISFRYGVIQVRLELAPDGRILAATTLQHPVDGRSGELSTEAIPQLEQALLESQEAQFDTVSGATYTTEAYRDSVQSALDRSGLR